MHAPNEPLQASGHSLSSPSHPENLSLPEMRDNKQRNEAQLDSETRWDQLQAQVEGTLAFLDSESSWKAFKLFNSASRPVKSLLTSTGPDSTVASLSTPRGYTKQAVLYPKSSKDVLAAMNFAYKSGIEISVKGGGYNPSSWSTRGTLILDLKELKSVVVHPANTSKAPAATPRSDSTNMHSGPTVHERSRGELTSTGVYETNTSSPAPNGALSSSNANGQKRKHSPSSDSGADSTMPPASEEMRGSSDSNSTQMSAFGSASTSSSDSSGSATPPIQTLLAQQAQDNAMPSEKGKRRMLDSDRPSSPMQSQQTQFIHANAYPPFNLVNADPEQSRAFHTRRRSRDQGSASFDNHSEMGSNGQSVPFIYDPVRKETVFPGSVPPGTIPFSNTSRDASSISAPGGSIYTASTSSTSADPNAPWPSVSARSGHGFQGSNTNGQASTNNSSGLSASTAGYAFGAADPSDFSYVSFGSGTTAQHLDTVTSTSEYVIRHKGEHSEPNEICRNDSGLECFVPWACYPVGSAIFLTGGYGFVSRLYGLSMDLVTELEIVLPPNSTASSKRAIDMNESPPMIDGELSETGRILKLKVDYLNDDSLSQEEKQEQEELWWACRGAGTAFGIVTHITAKAFNIGQVLAGNVIFPFNPATTPSLLKHWRDCLKVAPRELYTNFTLTAGPSERGHVVVIQFSWCGKKVQEGEAILQTMLSWDGERCLLKDVEIRPYKHQQENVSQILSSKDNTRWVVRSTLLKSLSDKSIHKTVDVFRKCQPGASWLFETAGGAIAEPPYPSCFPDDHRKAPFQVAALHQWTDPKDDEIQKQSAENWVYNVLKDEQCGPFPCFLASGEKGDRVKNVYGEENFKRLRTLKRKYDPHGLLKHNHFEDSLDTK